MLKNSFPSYTALRSLTFLFSKRNKRRTISPPFHDNSSHARTRIHRVFRKKSVTHQTPLIPLIINPFSHDNYIDYLLSHIPTTLLYFPATFCLQSLDFSQFSLDFFQLSHLLTPTMQGLFPKTPHLSRMLGRRTLPSSCIPPPPPQKKHLTNPLQKTFCNAHTRDIRHLKQKIVYNLYTPLARHDSIA